MRFAAYRLPSAACLAIVSGLLATAPAAQEDPSCDETCQATRDSQDPTASVRGIILNNSIQFGEEDDNDIYTFQLQPVATIIDRPWGNVIFRGIIPFVGAPTSAGDSGEFDTEWGVSDTTLQGIYVPPNQSGPISYGFGPSISIKTRESDETGGAGWGYGGILAVFGFSTRWNYGALISHLEGQEDYSQTTIQPIVSYTINESAIGPFFVGYNAPIVYDWNAEESDEDWTVPLGINFGKTFITPGANITTNIGFYDMVESGAAGDDWQLRFSANIFF